jgi:branched-subunit amino acid transport protein
MTLDRIELWAVILVRGAGTCLIRLSFLGLLGNRPLPDGLLRHLRYTAVAVMPGLVAPLVLWPPATGGVPDAACLTAAAIAGLAGLLTRSGLWAVVCGAAALYLTPVLPGLPG